jgi:hypothetical protein
MSGDYAAICTERAGAFKSAKKGFQGLGKLFGTKKVQVLKTLTQALRFMIRW